VFPAQADLVLLDLVVRDKAGRLVDDLRADEVQVREDGKPCAVRSFRLVEAEGGGTAGVPATGPVAVPAAKPEAETARPAPTGDGLVSVVALVFDQLGPEAASNARAAALQLADRSFPKGSVFAVFKVGQGLAVLQSFTEDRALLPAAIEKATIGTDQARDPARRAGYDNATGEAFPLAREAQAAVRNKEPDARFRAMEAHMLLFSDSVTREGQGQASLQPLLAIARTLSLVQGRKSLLYFSEGLTVPPSGETETLVWVEVPSAGLALTPGETTYRGHVSLLAQVKDETGTLLARLSHDAPIEGPLARATTSGPTAT